MKKCLLSFLPLLFTIISYADILPPNEPCQLIDHLTEVNKEWAKQSFHAPFLNEIFSFQNDNQRIQKHLELVAWFLKNKSNDHLDMSQKINRINQLNVLNEYWQKGQFPRNTFHQKRQPYFVDVYGTACAVGYLVLESGEKELVEKISTENNFAYVEDMQFPALENWATENGFTKPELAWIQPGYPPPHHIYGTVGNNGGIVGHVNVMKTSPDGEHLYFAGNFSEIDGQAANNIIAYDGESWIDLNAPIEGEIFDIAFHPYGGMIVVGDFLIDGHKNVANYKFDTETWTHGDITDMDGVIYAVLEHNTRVVIGGDFSTINGQDYQNLAIATLADSFAWSNSSFAYDGTMTVEVLNSFGVDGEVRALQKSGFHILVGGDFLLTAPEVSHPDLVTQQETSYLAQWSAQQRDWVTGFEGGHVPVNAALINEGAIFVGGEVETGQMESPFSVHTAGVWVNTGYFDASNGMIHTICPYGDYTVVGGEFIFFEGVVGLWSDNLTVVNSEGEPAINTSVNGAVHACAEFQNKLFFAGDFSQASATSVNRLAWTEFDLQTSSQENHFQDLSIFMADNQLFVKDIALAEDATINLFDLQGRLVDNFEMNAGQDDYYFDLTDLPKGAYVYHLQNATGQASGKLVNF